MAYNFKRGDLIIAVLSFFIMLHLFNADLALGITLPCEVNQRFYPECINDWSYKQGYCTDFGYPAYNIFECSQEDICKHGQCMPARCETSVSICATDFSTLHRECVNGRYIDSLEICERELRCMEGACTSGGEFCGDGICDYNETIENCYVDCWAMASWSALTREVSNDPVLQEYTQCSEMFDCDKQEIIDLAEHIFRNLEDNSPKGYVDAVSGFVYNYVTYPNEFELMSVSEGVCGQSASDLIDIKESTGIVKGNCVSKSTLMVTLLRAKGIPARQLGGCLSHIGFECYAFSIAGIPLQYGYMNERQPLAHAYLEVWADREIGWILADPTMGYTMSKCVGYYTLTTQGRDHQQLCFLDVAYVDYCKEL